MPIEFSKRAMQGFSPEFRTRILKVYDLFPELQNKKITCGLIVRNGRLEGAATGWTSPPTFRLRPNVSSYTIAHELTHLVQGNGSGIPHGEITCDIWTICRLPIEMLDQRPYYLLPRSKFNWKRNRVRVKELCREAVELRELQRTYIVWLRSKLRELG